MVTVKNDGNTMVAEKSCSSYRISSKQNLSFSHHMHCKLCAILDPRMLIKIVCDGRPLHGIALHKHWATSLFDLDFR